MTKKKKTNKPQTVQRFKVLPSGKTEALPEPPKEPVKGVNPVTASTLAEQLQNLDPEKVKAFDEVIKGLFKTLQADQPPKMFQCGHCGGFHAFDINCSVCNGTTKAQQAFTMDRLDKMFALAMCQKCLAVSVAIFQCHGIDPDRADLQHELAENAKAQRGADPEPEPEPG